MKRIVSLLLLFVLIFLAITPAEAHDRGKHDEELELVLFGNRWYAESRPLIVKTVRRLEDAAYLAIDQFNSQGETELKNLNNDKIPGIPTSIDDFKFQTFYHRQYTHRGWNVTYDEKAHWTIRQTILINTIKAKFPIINNKQAEAFAVLVYYVHILGDHIEAKKHTSLSYLSPLSNSHDRDNPGILPDLIKYLDDLFEDQKNDEQYIALKRKLETLSSECDHLYHSIGGIQEREFPQYHQYAFDLLELLSTYVPTLLKNEKFFYDVIY